MAVRVVEGFDRVAWSGLTSSSPLLSADWLEVMSSRLPGVVHTLTEERGVGFVGAVVTAPGAYEAYNPYTILWRDPPVFELTNTGIRRQELMAEPVDPARVLPALVLAAPGYLGDPAGGAAGSPEAVRSCLVGARDWAAGRGLASVHLLYCGDTDTMDRATEGLDAVRFPLTTRWRLPVWWDDWDGYLDGVKRSRRREIQREVRRAEESGVTARRIDVAGHLDEIIQARCALLAAYGQTADEPAETHRLRGLLRTFGRELTAYAAYHGDDLAAVSVCVRHGRSVHVVYTGTTALGRQLPFAHFLATFYAVIRHAGRAELDEIDYGIGHGAGKRLRGCQGRPTYGYALGVDSALRPALARAAALLTEGT